MHRREEGLDSRIGRARLPLYHPGRGGTRGTTARYFIADSAKHFQLIGSVTPMSAMTALDHGDPVSAFPGANSWGWDFEQQAGLLDGESHVHRRHFGAETTAVRVGHGDMSDFTASRD